MTRNRRVWDGWALALFAGLLLRAAFVWQHPRFVGDTLIYADLARNLIHHHLYGVTELRGVRPTLIRLPGYPIFLAGCFRAFGENRYFPVVWVQVGVDLLTCVLLGAVAKRLFGGRAQRVTLWLAALCPFTANYAAAALTETWSIFCVALALWGLLAWMEGSVRGGRSFVAALLTGGALAWAVLLRPDGVLLAGAVVPAMAWAASRRAFGRGRAWAGTAIAATLLVCSLGVWTGRNWVVFHVVQPLAPKYANDPGEAAPAGFARWYRTWAVDFGSTNRVYWSYDGSPLMMSDLPPRAFDSAEQKRQTAALIERYNGFSAATPAVDRAFDSLAQERIRVRPLRYFVVLPLAKLADMWLRPRTELMRVPLDWWRFDLRPWTTVFQVSYGLVNALLLGAAVLGAWRWQRSGWGPYPAFAAAALGYVLLRCALLLTIDNSEPRYVLECYPVVLLMAALAVSRASERAVR